MKEDLTCDSKPPGIESGKSVMSAFLDVLTGGGRGTGPP